MLQMLEVHTTQALVQILVTLALRLVTLVQTLVALVLLLRDSTHLPRAEDGFKVTRPYALVLHQLR